jgi:transposase
MGWFRVKLSEEQQKVVNAERDSHPQEHVRRKMLVLWLLHCGLTREKAAFVTCLGRATVQRYVAAFRQGGLDGLRHWGVTGPVSDLAAHHDCIREEFTQKPARTIAEACERIERLTGVRRQPSQVRKFLKGLGLKWQRVRALPVPPKKTLGEHVKEQARFLDEELNPRLEEAKAGQRHVFFVDAAHMVFGTFVCCLWSFVRLFVRAASGRQRFNVLGAWDAVAGQLTAVTNATVVNTETMCELLRKLASQGLSRPITLVLDNARYQRNAVVQALAASLGIELLYLPPYSPNLNLIERLWRFIKREALYGRYHPTFADFQAAIQDTLGQLSTKHSDRLASLMTLNFQVFDHVSLLAA